MTNRGAFIGWGVGTCALLLAAASLRAADPTLTVKYRSASAIYVDGGKAQGLQLGDRLAVVSGSDRRGLGIVYLANSASCQVLHEKRTVRAGDRVVRLAREGEVAPPAAAPTPVPTPIPTPTPIPGLAVTPEPLSRPKGRLARVRGGVSFGAYRVWDQSESQFDFQQRTGRADVSAWDIGGKPLFFNLRFRSRQDIRAQGLASRTPTDKRDDRLYELALRYQPRTRTSPSRWDASAPPISWASGASTAPWPRCAWPPRPCRSGASSERRAEPDNLDLDVPGLKYGGFLRLAPAGRYSRQNYEAVVAVVRENGGRREPRVRAWRPGSAPAGGSRSSVR
jgi:hypothetical protein